MDQGSDRGGDRFQVRLWDLIVLVVGAAYVLDVARRSRIAWGGGLPDLAHAIGLSVLTLGLCVGLVVVGQWARRVREREGRRSWAILWRVLAVGWLAGSVVEVAAAVQVANTLPTTLALRAFGDQATMRLRLTSLMTTLGMVGLLLAVGPLRARPGGPRARPKLGSWPSVVMAALVGIVLLALGHGFIPYLVLLAMEAVHNALRLAPRVPRPILFDRMVTACLQALPGLVGCLATAIWVDDDLRAAGRDPSAARTPRTWPGVLSRASTVALAAIGSAYTLAVSVPTMSPPLAEGLLATVDPSAMATVALGFAVLAAGLSGRSAAYLVAAPDPFERPVSPLRRVGPWPRRVVGGLVGLVSLEIAAAAVHKIRGDVEPHWYVPIGLDDWAHPARWLDLVTGSRPWDLLVERPDDFLIGLAATWSTLALAGLLMAKGPGRSTPLDAVAADRLALGRFLGWWLGLSTAILASLPGVAILALTLLHFLLKWVAR